MPIVRPTQTQTQTRPQNQTQTVPLPPSRPVDNNATTTSPPTAHRPRVVRCLSVGGGPAFDDVALRVLASFLQATCTSLPPADPRLVPATVETVVLDLYDEAWTPAIEGVNAAVRASRREAGGISTNGSVSIGHCDIRAPLSSPDNAQFLALTPECDLFAFSFVLHENAEYMLVDKYEDAAEVELGDVAGDAGGAGAGATVGAGAGAAGDGSVEQLVGGCLPGLFGLAKIGEYARR